MVRLVLRCRDAFGSESNRLSVNRIDILDVNIDRTDPGLDVRWQLAGLDPDQGVTDLVC